MFGLFNNKSKHFDSVAMPSYTPAKEGSFWPKR